MKFNNILESIGNTPHVRLNKLFPADYEVFIKLERNNPGASIKDRIALAMIEDAEKKGILTKNSTIIEPPPAIPASVWRWCAPLKDTNSFWSCLSLCQSNAAKLWRLMGLLLNSRRARKG